MLDLDIIIVSIYLLSMLAIGMYASRGIRDLSHYSVADRSFPAIIIFATLSASFIGGGFTMGNAEKVFSWGVAYIVILWGFSLKEIMVAKIIVPRLEKFRDAISVGDIMAKAYGRPGKLLAGFLAVPACAGVAGAQVSAIGYIFNLFLDIPHLWGILIGFGILITYSTLGGMRAVVLTDVLQFGILALGFPLLFILGWLAVGGLDTLQVTLPAGHLDLFGHMSVVAVLSLFLTFVLGEALVPPYVQRLLIGKNIKHVARGTLWSGLFSIPFFAIVGCLGLFAVSLNADIDPYLAIPYMIDEVMPVGLKGLLIAGIIAVVMSSADSFLNSAAVAFTNDVVVPLKKKNPLNASRKLALARILTFLTGTLAVVFALSIASVLEIMVLGWTFWAPIILVPLVAALLGFVAHPRVLYSSTLAGVSAVLIWEYLLQTPFDIAPLVVGVIANLLVFVSTYKTQREKDSTSIDYQTETQGT